ncbi:MAG: MarR family transcriptional regulator [Actinobacteria bacterium]|jgi:DNA-binding MarR family transcriptional regulator|nr:MarR family transcriptional regulator [Actinomycetota bacterium]
MSDLDDAAASVLTASRALLAVVARSVAPILDQVTVPQFRVLVLLSNADGPVRHGDLAAALDVHSTTFTRTIDRMVSGGWVERRPNPDSRRETLISATAAGVDLVREVTEARRREIRAILAALPARERAAVGAALAAFAEAAGEQPAPVLAEFSL